MRGGVTVSVTTFDIPDDWVPTGDTINALPEPLRRYIMHLETHADPQFTLQENWQLREQVKQLEAMLRAEREGR